MIAADTPDWTFGSFWAHPERVLDHRRARRRQALRGCPRRWSTVSAPLSSGISHWVRGTPGEMRALR